MRTLVLALALVAAAAGAAAADGMRCSDPDDKPGCGRRSDTAAGAVSLSLCLVAGAVGRRRR